MNQKTYFPKLRNIADFEDIWVGGCSQGYNSVKWVFVGSIDLKKRQCKKTDSGASLAEFLKPQMLLKCLFFYSFLKFTLSPFKIRINHRKRPTDARDIVTQRFVNFDKIALFNCWMD